jgi:hypothetical protein
VGLRRHRRNLVVWRQSAGTDGPARVTGPARSRRIRRRLRIVFLLTVVGLLPAIRAVRARWRPLLAGTALTTAGLVHRGGWGMVLLPGLLLLLSAPLVPAPSQAERLRRSKLESELAAYSTNAQRFDLEATLDQYPDGDTHELRDILTRQATTAGNSRIPGGGTG